MQEIHIKRINAIKAFNNVKLVERFKHLTLKKGELQEGNSFLRNRIAEFTQFPNTYKHVVEKSTIFIAKLDKEIVGWALVLPANKYHMVSIYINPEKRRYHIGTQMMERIIGFCKQTDKTLICKGWNKQSKSFYSKFGFKDIQSTNPSFHLYMKLE